jgi:hypothetical protein
MKSNKNILVIENQYFEFKAIYNFLKEFNVYPTPVFFKGFINNVHVALNKQYNKEYRQLALNNIDNIVNGVNDPFNNNKPVDIMLIDHILGGAHFCHTGIDLANYINSFRKNNPIPVVFLSRTPQEGKTKLEGVDTGSNSFDLLLSTNRLGYEYGYKMMYKNSCDWVHKGYFGDDCLDETFFNKYVIQAITNIILLSEKDKLINALSHILLHYRFSHNESELENKLRHIKESIINNSSYSNDFIEYIFELRSKFIASSQYPQLVDNDIDIINKQFESISV